MAAKKAKTTVFQSWDEVDASLKELAVIEETVTKGEVAMNEEINRIKEIYDDKCKPLLARRKELEDNLKVFTKSRINEFTDSKSRHFTFGEVGFRKVTSITGRNVKAIIEALKKHRMYNCIDIKESLNKDRLSEYDDASLEKVGAYRKIEEKFYFKIDRERIEG